MLLVSAPIWRTIDLWINLFYRIIIVLCVLSFYCFVLLSDLFDSTNVIWFFLIVWVVLILVVIIQIIRVVIKIYLQIFRWFNWMFNVQILLLRTSCAFFLFFMLQIFRSALFFHCFGTCLINQYIWTEISSTLLLLRFTHLMLIPNSWLICIVIYLIHEFG